jgi:hypothetical protein
MDAEVALKTNGGSYIPEISKKSKEIIGTSGRNQKQAGKQLFENLSKDKKKPKDITTEEHEYRKHKEFLRKQPEI